jgi:FkbM family methyltransferase
MGRMSAHGLFVRVARSVSAIAGYDLERQNNTLIAARRNVDAVRRLRQLHTYLFRKQLATALERYRIDCVLDVGAHTGTYGVFLRELGFQGIIHSFEPVPAAFNELETLSAADAAWHAHPIAIGATDGTLEIHVARNLMLSSTRPYSERGRTFFRGAGDITATIEAPLRRLDSMIAELGVAGVRILLKADTQGYNNAVYEGCALLLESVHCIHTETSITPLYEGALLVDDEIAFLRERGYALAGLHPINYTGEGAIQEADCIFARLADLSTTRA